MTTSAADDPGARRVRNHVYLSYRAGLASTATRVRDLLGDALVADAELRDGADLDGDGGFPAALHRALQQVCAAVVLIDDDWLDAADPAGGASGEGHDRWVPTEVALCLASRPDVRVVPALLDDTELPGAGPAESLVGELRGEESVRLRAEHLDADLVAVVRQVQALVHQAPTHVPSLADLLAAADEPERLPLDDHPLLERCLVEAARADSEAFAALYRHHLPAVHADTYRRTRSREIAEDVTAATFEEAYRHLDRFDAGTGARFGPWLLRIASRHLGDRRP